MINFRSKEMRMLAIGFACAVVLAATTGCGGGGGSSSSDKKMTIPDSATAAGIAEAVFWEVDGFSSVGNTIKWDVVDAAGGALVPGVYEDRCHNGTYTLAPGNAWSVVFANFGISCAGAEYPQVSGGVNFSYTDANGAATYTIGLQNLGIAYSSGSSDTLNGDIVQTWHDADDTYEYSATLSVVWGGVPVTFDALHATFFEGYPSHIELTYGPPAGIAVVNTTTDFTYDASCLTPVNGVMTITDSTGVWVVDFAPSAATCGQVLVTKPDGTKEAAAWDA